MSNIDSQTHAEMPRYKCHKRVWALKIQGISRSEETGRALIYPVELGYAPIEVTEEYLQKHQPKSGGYYVVYEDGYKSFSPAEAFESGYTPIPYPESDESIALQRTPES